MLCSSIDLFHPNPTFDQIIKSIDSYPSFYSSCLRDLQLCQDKLDFTQLRFALEVILGMAWLEKNADEIANISDEQQRNVFITKRICLVAEPGLIPGHSQDAVRNILAQRIDEFKQAYLFDKERGCAAAFFAYAFVGPPCFNGRLITLQEYIVREQQRSSTYAFERTGIYDKEACELENLIYDYQLQVCKDFPTLHDLKKYMKANNHPLLNHPNLADIFQRAREFAASNQ